MISVNYEKMWKDMKLTYENRLKTLEMKGKKGTNAYINAKRFVDVMSGFELSEKERIQEIADISINYIREMSEEL
jgi:hypothetical protein